MKKRLTWPLAAGFCVMTLAAPLAMAQNTPARFPLTATQIMDAMQKRQLPTQGVQLKLAVPITSVVANPVLEIQAIEPVNSHEIRLRMSCLDHSACLPFFAVARYTESVDLAVTRKRSEPLPAVTPKPPMIAKAVAESPAASPSNRPAISSEPPVVRSGSPAMLDFDEDRVHVRVEVICLESGGTGDKIHVTTRDHRQVYIAEIVAPRSLKGTLIR